MASTTRTLPNGREFALEFHRRVWVEPHGLECDRRIDNGRLSHHVGRYHSRGSRRIDGVDGRKQHHPVGSNNETLDIFTDATVERVVFRWNCRGSNNSIFGLPPDGRSAAFSGIAIWRREADAWRSLGSSSALSSCITYYENRRSLINDAFTVSNDPSWTMGLSDRDRGRLREDLDRAAEGARSSRAVRYLVSSRLRRDQR